MFTPPFTLALVSNLSVTDTCLILLARPKRLELLTPRFVVSCCADFAFFVLQRSPADISGWLRSLGPDCSTW
jgi:hypothetical protein